MVTKQAARCVAVAYSGGRDSTALLHATLAQAAEHGVQVLALHVHHGLHPNADAWLAHCAAQCARWSRGGRALTFVSHRLGAGPKRGDSVEAWARAARYAALREMALAHGAGIVLLAQHRRDQAETWLLQALRGAGVAGLSGMAKCMLRGGLWWHRPWLDQSGEAIAAYVRRHRLKHIEDDTNADTRFARNRLRLLVWPALTGAFAQAEAALATAAVWSQQAAAALDELAALDLTRVAQAAGQAGAGQPGGPDALYALEIAAWLELSPARRSNALRAWLKAQCGAGAPASLVERLLDELPVRRNARWLLGTGELWLYRGMLRWMPAPPLSPSATSGGTGHGTAATSKSAKAKAKADAAAPTLLSTSTSPSTSPVLMPVTTPAPAPAPAPVPVPVPAPAPASDACAAATAAIVPRETRLGVSHAGSYALPGWSGCLQVEPVDEGGVPLAWLARLELRERVGAERFQAGIGRPPRSLKKQFQDAGVPAWCRSGPLLYSGGQLVFVPGLGLDARVIGPPDASLVALRWTADASAQPPDPRQQAA